MTIQYICPACGKECPGGEVESARIKQMGHCGCLEATKPSNPKDLVGVGKAPMSTVSAPVLAEIGVAMLEGACKYGRHNYRAVGVRASVYYDALMRHIMAWWEGQDTDPDSGMPHIVKAVTTLVVLRDAQIQGMVEDDRPPSSPEFYTELNKLAAQIIERHKDKNPKHYTITHGRGPCCSETTSDHKA